MSTVPKVPAETQEPTATQEPNKDLWKKYYDSLNEKEKQTIAIGREILKDSFEIEKTIGFKQWRAAQQAAQDQTGT